MQFERCNLVNMLHFASQVLGGTSFVILLIFPDKGMIWQFVKGTTLPFGGRSLSILILLT